MAQFETLTAPSQGRAVRLENGRPAVAADPWVHCGFCMPTCASGRVLTSEMDSIPQLRRCELSPRRAGTHPPARVRPGATGGGR